MARTEYFKIGSPSVTVETTSPDQDGSWLASGTVTFELPTGEKLTFPFTRARNSEEAIQSALEGVERYLKRFDRAVSHLREGMA